MLGRIVKVRRLVDERPMLILVESVVYDSVRRGDEQYISDDLS